jgi:molybdopterin molybdotransferase
MLSVLEARRTILAHAAPLPAEALPLGPGSLGRVLAEDVACDADAPPFDKAMMDGYAVRSADLAAGKAQLRVVDEVRAGQTPRVAVGPGEATRIMTGAPMPEGADAVVVVERTRVVGGRVEVDDRPPRAGQHILRRGAEMRQGEVVVPAGAVLRPQELGVLAAVGRTAALQAAWPRVAVLATGDELVEAGQTPGPGQIRNSNGPMLLALAHAAGGRPLSLGVGRDTLDGLRPLVRRGLENADVLLLAGGVSAGKADLVPEALAAEGVVSHFHKVAMKPGKPLLFGTHEAAGRRVLVFGLPGNPVSAFVCFALFVRPALRRLAGRADLDLPAVRGALAGAFANRSDRPTYHPARLDETAAGWRVTAVRSQGSADLRAFLSANALLVLPAGEVSLPASEPVEALRLDD